MNTTTPSTLAEELPPADCPLCGGPADTRCSRDGEVVWVQCKAADCKTHGPTRYIEVEAISLWNRRTTTSPAEVKEACAKVAEDGWMDRFASAIQASPGCTNARGGFRVEDLNAAIADRGALDGYRAAVGYISADSWDGCSDCIDILKAARAADLHHDWAGDCDRLAAELARLRSFTSRALPLPQQEACARPGEEVVERVAIKAALEAAARCVENDSLAVVAGHAERLAKRIRALEAAMPLTVAQGQLWQDISTAPRDGTLLELVVDYSGGDHALQDASVACTIGFNNFDHDGEDEWKFAGWCWSHDHFVQGKGRVIAWRSSRLNASDDALGALPETPATTREADHGE